MRLYCRVTGCSNRIPDRYLMCPGHWRMVPPEVKRLWQTQWTEERTPGWREALTENLREVLRIVKAVEAGVPA